MERHLVVLFFGIYIGVHEQVGSYYIKFGQIRSFDHQLYQHIHNNRASRLAPLEVQAVAVSAADASPHN
jgi:hypothetical protein